MQQFIAKFEKDIQGVMSGFDRVLFRGSLRRLTHSLGMKWYLAQNDILCKQYEDHVKGISQRVKQAALAPFQQQGLPVKHVFGSDNKENLARAFAAERHVTEGDVCAFTAMEMAPTFQHAVNWTERLHPFAQRLNPLHEEIFRNYPTQYYWTGFQCEWATDVLFRPGTLRRLAPLLLEHGMLSFSSPDILQFLGHRINVSGQIPANYTGELTSDFKSRASGDRVKYRIDGNSLKGYGKASTPVGDLYRVETLTQHVEVFQSYRPKEGGADDDLQWRQMRRGVADMHRRAEVSQKANERYWDALSTVDDSTRFSEFTRALEQPCQYQGRRVRALHLFQAGDHQLLQAVNRGEFALNGLRNRDLQRWLYGPVDPLRPLTLKEKRRRSAAVSRKLRMLRAHGLIQKVPKTHRYQVTAHGRLAITAILTMDRTSIALLNQAAA